MKGRSGEAAGDTPLSLLAHLEDGGNDDALEADPRSRRARGGPDPPAWRAMAGGLLTPITWAWNAANLPKPMTTARSPLPPDHA